MKIIILHSQISYFQIMEEAEIPTLQKTTSVGLKLQQHDNQQNNQYERHKLGSFPQLPKDNDALLKSKLLLIRNVSCFDRYRNHQIETNEQRKDLYRRIYDFIKQIIDNPSKIQELLNTLNQMENSIKSAKKQKGSIKSNDSAKKTIQKTNEQQPLVLSKSTKSQNMTNSITLVKEQAQQNIPTFQPSYEICQDMAESIQLQYPREDSFASYDKIEVAQSQSLSNSNFGKMMKSIQLHMLDSLKIPQLTQVYKNVSIFLSQDSKSSLFSQGSQQTLDHIEFSQVSFRPQLIVALFGDASPFLINLALSLLFKFILKSKVKLSANNVYWILGITVIVSYKIFHDETLQGIIDYFSEVLRLKFEEITYLQRWFLKELNYEVLINNKHYTEIMMNLLKIQ